MEKGQANRSGYLQNEIHDCRFPKFWSFIGGKTPDTTLVVSVKKVLTDIKSSQLSQDGSSTREGIVHLWYEWFFDVRGDRKKALNISMFFYRWTRGRRRPSQE